MCVRAYEREREREMTGELEEESHSDKPQGREVTARREEKVLKLYKGTAANDSHFQNALHLRMKSFFTVRAALANSNSGVDGLLRLLISVIYRKDKLIRHYQVCATSNAPVQTDEHQRKY